MISFLSDIKIYDRIDVEGYEHEIFSNRYGKYLEKLLNKVGLLFCRQSASDDLQELKGQVIITLGVNPTKTLLMLEKRVIRLADYIGKEHFIDEKVIIPWYNLHYLLISGKKVEEDTTRLFREIKEKYGNF